MRFRQLATLLLTLCIVNLLLACSDSGSASSSDDSEAKQSAEKHFTDKVVQQLEREMLIGTALSVLELAENYTPENFEERQLKALENASESLRPVAMEHLPRRVKENKEFQGHSKFSPDMSTATLETTVFGKAVRGKFYIDGDRWWSATGREPRTDRVRMGVTLLLKRDATDSPVTHSGWTLEILD